MIALNGVAGFWILANELSHRLLGPDQWISMISVYTIIVIYRHTHLYDKHI